MRLRKSELEHGVNSLIRDHNFRIDREKPNTYYLTKLVGNKRFPETVVAQILMVTDYYELGEQIIAHNLSTEKSEEISLISIGFLRVNGECIEKIIDISNTESVETELVEMFARLETVYQENVNRISILKNKLKGK